MPSIYDNKEKRDALFKLASQLNDKTMMRAALKAKFGKVGDFENEKHRTKLDAIRKRTRDEELKRFSELRKSKRKKGSSSQEEK